MIRAASHLSTCRRPVFLAGLLALILPACLANSAVTQTPEELRQAIQQIVSQPRFAAASWGIKVVSLEGGAIVYEHQAGKLHKPASNAKLFTGALALDRLGPDFRIRTSLLARQEPDARGRLRGDLIAYGRGDPAFAPRFHGGDPADSLIPLAKALTTAGVKRIDGDLIADESFFRGETYGGSWTWEDLQYYYGAPVSALTVNDNTLDLVILPGTRAGEPGRIMDGANAGFLSFVNQTTTGPAKSRTGIELTRPPGSRLVQVNGSLALDAARQLEAVSVPDPAEWFGVLLKQSLAKQGITVTGKVRTVDWRERELKPLDRSNWHEVAGVDSPPLNQMVTAMMKPSQNLYAQLLLLQVGENAAAKGTGASTSEQAGLAELGRFLDGAEIPRREVLFDEGSGLSRTGLVTPNAIIALLRHMHRHPQAEAFLAALPVAGVDGTLADRMKGTAAAQNVRAKTGTIRYVNALSGYVTTAAGERLAFALTLNNYLPPDDAPSARADLDAIAVLVAEFAGRVNPDQIDRP